MAQTSSIRAVAREACGNGPPPVAQIVPDAPQIPYTIDGRAPRWIRTVQHNLLRNKLCCAIVKAMPVAVSRKVEALRADFRSAAQLADLLGVNRSQVMRWLRGAGIDPLNAEKVDLLDLVWSNLLRLYDRDAALSWLFGVNPSLGDRRPVDLIRMGRAEELMRAIRAERSDSFA